MTEERAAPSAGQVEVRALGAGEEDLYFDFLRRSLPAAERVIEVHCWRRDSAPASGGVETTVAVLDDRIVGAQSTTRVELTYRGGAMSCAYHLDTIVNGQVRGQGIGRKLTLATSRPWAVTMAKGTHPGMYALRRSIGFQDVPHSTFMVRPVGLPRTPRLAALRLASFATGALMLSARATRRDDDLSITPTASFGEEFDELEVRSRQAAVLRAAKPAAYLDWRYATCPGRTYELHRIDGRDGLRGAAVLRWKDGELWLVDLVLEPGDPTGAHALVSHVVSLARRRGVRSIRTFATAPAARRSLAAFGFVDTRYSPRFTYILGPGAMDLPYDRLDWDFWHGDSDTELYG